MRTFAKLRTWGSSIGVLVPSDIIKKENLHTGEEVLLEITKKPSLKDLFGILKDSKINAQKIKDESRKLWNG